MFNIVHFKVQTTWGTYNHEVIYNGLQLMHVLYYATQYLLFIVESGTSISVMKWCERESLLGAMEDNTHTCTKYRLQYICLWHCNLHSKCVALVPCNYKDSLDLHFKVIVMSKHLCA